jgi:FkbM family methyltransferase
MWRFIVAQIASRRIPGEVCVELANGTRLLIPPKMKGAAHFIYPGMCEFDEMAFVLHFLRPSELFVDIGANIGAYSVLAAGGVGAEAVAFEPSPRTFSQLKRNIALNELGNRVKIKNVALGAVAGKIEFTQELGTENHVVTGQARHAGATESIVVNTLDAELVELNPRLIKIDVEGFETKVFESASGVLENRSLAGMIVERNGSGTRYGHDENLLHERIRGAGFCPCRYRALDRTIVRESERYEGNIIYLRDPVSAEQSVRTAPVFRVNGMEF